jgi:GNAT superfamily N-acetyltransferase
MTSCRLPAEAHRTGRATVDDVPGAAAALAEAFLDYPWTRWVVDAADHRARLEGLLGSTVSAVGMPYGDVWVVRCGVKGSVVAAAVALRPDRPVPDTVWARLAAAESELLGDRLGAAEEADRLTAGWRPAEPHLMVATLGVRPDHQRRGLASALVAHLVDTADELGVLAYLETSTEANVALYRGFGFAVSDYAEIPDGGPPVWAMRRPPV